MSDSLGLDEVDESVDSGSVAPAEHVRSPKSRRGVRWIGPHDHPVGFAGAHASGDLRTRPQPPTHAMPRDDQHLLRIREYADHERLLVLWDAIQRGDTPDWDAGRAFEHLVLRGFELEGATVRWPYTVRWNSDSGEESQAEQVDGVVYAEGLACLCESKDHSHKVNVDPIAKLRNQLARRPSNTIGCLFSSRGFTKPALYLARFVSPQTILLWNGPDVHFALRNRCFVRGLTAKFRDAVEHGLQDIDLQYLITPDP